MKKQWILLFIPILLLFTMQVKAIDYKLPDLDGNMQSLDQYRGNWVIVNYWATWCSTCMKELPDLVDLYENNKNRNVVVVGINFEEIGLQELKHFVAERGIPFPVWHSEPIPITPLGRVPALPTTYIIDPNGKLVAGEIGIVTREHLEDYIASKMSTGEYDSAPVVRKSSDI